MNKNSSTTSRRMLAAVVVGTALSAIGLPNAEATQPAPDTVQDITRYCQVCWRNARLHPDSWSDCTQEVLVRLLQTVEPDRWSILLKQDDGEDRKEFIRAIDAVKKRNQRARRPHSLADDVADRSHADPGRNELREQIETASARVLSARQQRIIQLTCDGWSIPEIAGELKTTVERVSDEKYKAIRKLRKDMTV